ncbi:uncharacterized protein LOC129912019 [Episyrphus balteatus]|uniref:uncharacterized protein LOC129912019 n=1 Tax=Episyrphus balteatus TaxID=286459 RepID=UPI0024864A84|nr:uncharacterized protein LOC129912019 [Episyrphus balteatus]
MDSTNINIKNLTKIPDNEFKQHFRDWMEQDDVARSLQAKLRKDLIANFNKTSLGKKIIAQTGVSHRLNLSPLLLALNTLAAEFLYALNCHFTLSVFCTEVPYRNTLPDFESAHHFRFSEREIFEILDALASNFDMDTKQSISKEYSSKRNNPSLLFVIIKNLLSKPKEENKERQELLHPTTTTIPQKSNQMPAAPPTSTPTQTDKLDSTKVQYQSKNFRYLNKYLMILSKKMKEMSVNLDVLQKRNLDAPPQQTVKKSLQARKFENLNRNLEKISENLRHLSVSKRKNKRLSAVVTAVNTMAQQFEKCLLNFDQLNKGMAKGGAAVVSGGQKSYSDWIHEMRTTDNGKLFLDKIESSLSKTLQRERKKMETELAQRIQIQKDMLKSKYKHKLTEELSVISTSRGKTDNCQQANDVFEKKLNEFEVKHKELHLKIQEAEKRLTESSTQNAQPEMLKNKITQTTTKDIDIPTKSIQILANEQNQLQEMVKNISEQERQVDHIVFDAKLRVQELEHESNQLDRSFRDYLERQRSEKQKMRENATSIWQSYALGKSILKAKSIPSRLNTTTTTKVEKNPSMTFERISATADLTIPTICIDDVSTTSISPPVFENPFRIAKSKVLSRTKTTTFPKQPSPPASPLPELPLTDTTATDSIAENCTRDQQLLKSKQQRPTILRLIEHKDEKDKIRTKMPNHRTDATHSQSKLNQPTHHELMLSPEFNTDDITLDGIELSPTTAKSSSIRSGDSSCSSARGVFKLKRQLFATNSGKGSPSSSTTSNAQQIINDNDDNKEPKEPLAQINKHQIAADVDRKKVHTEGRHNKDAAVNKEIMKMNLDGRASENKDVEEELFLGTSTGVELVDPLKMMEKEEEEDATSQ